MADLRIPSGVTPPSPARPAAPARSETVLAAQRAFFEAALGQAQTPAAAARPVQAATPIAAAPPIARTAAPRLDPQNPPERLLRPGSIIDIKV